MLRYILGRLALLVPVLIGVSLLSFGLIHLIPGDIVSVIAGPNVAVDSEAAENIRKSLHLDVPLIVQYGYWISGILRGDFGNSLVQGLPIGPQIAARLPITLLMTAMALVISVVLGLPTGVWAATARGRAADVALRAFALLGVAAPQFFVGVTLVLLLSIYAPSVQIFGIIDLGEDFFGGAKNLFLPAFVLSLPSVATVMRYTRSAVLEVMGEQYIVTARAKGAGRPRVLLKHGLRTALLPVVTAIGVTTAQLVAGAVVVEQVFGLPGIGQLMLNAIYHRDYTQIQGTVLVVATLVVLINVAVDLSYHLLDPRIRLHG